MKVTVGVEYPHQGMGLVNFLHALDFESIVLQLCYVLEIGAETGVYGEGFDYSTGHLSAYFQQLKDEGHEALREVSRHAGEKEFLRPFAEDTDSALLVIGSNRKTAIQRFVLDSTSRKAVISARESVLVVKNPLLAEKKLTAVCATDHSPYSQACLEQFFRWHPRGIRHAIILSIPSDRSGPDLDQENDRLIKKLDGRGTTFESRVASGSVGDTIAEIMQETGADLLVLGSQGHGFMERLTIGSVSLEQAMNRPYSVLVIRKLGPSDGI